jgi:predicted glutamine amidotransferase
MHNGQVGGYDGFRRDADMMIPEALYPHRKGATDSEALFLVAWPRGWMTIRAGRWNGRRRGSSGLRGPRGRGRICG